MASPAPTPPTSVPWKRWFLPTLAITAALDLATKSWVFARHHEGERFHAWGETAYNSGVAWGLFGDYPLAVLALTVVLIPVLTVVWWRQFRREGAAANLAFGLILGGAVGNGYDRVMMGLHQHARMGDAPRPWPGFPGVRDFIRIDLNPIGIDYIWPNFNVADAAISVGFVLLVGLMLFATGPSPSRPTLDRAST